MHTRNWLFALGAMFALLTTVFLSTGCKKADNGSGQVDSALVGKWRLTSMSVNGSAFFPPSDIGWSVDLTLDDDERLTYAEVWQGASETTLGSWSVTSGVVNMHSSSFSWQGPYTVSGGTFTGTFANYDGEGHLGVLVFTRL